MKSARLTPLSATIEAVLRANLAIGSLNISLGQVLLFTVTVWASFLASRFLRFLLEEDVYYHLHLGRGIPQAISTIIHYSVLLLGFFVALAVLGVDLTKVGVVRPNPRKFRQAVCHNISGSNRIESII
jgi:potassium-dependent mechanosensitive channel